MHSFNKVSCLCKRFKINTGVVLYQRFFFFFQAAAPILITHCTGSQVHPAPPPPTPTHPIFQRSCCCEGWSKALSSPINQMWVSAPLPPANPSFLSLSFLSILLLWTQKARGPSNAIVYESYVRVIKAYVCMLYSPDGFLLVFASFYSVRCTAQRDSLEGCFCHYINNLNIVKKKVVSCKFRQRWHQPNCPLCGSPNVAVRNKQPMNWQQLQQNPRAIKSPILYKVRFPSLSSVQIMCRFYIKSLVSDEHSLYSETER